MEGGPPPGGRGGRGEALRALLAQKQAARRRGQQEELGGNVDEVPAQDPVIERTRPSPEELSLPSLSSPAPSTLPSSSSAAVPTGRATLMAALRERNRLSREPVAQPPAQSSTSLESTIIPFREPLPPGPEGRARLLETLRVKSRQQLAAPADRARALAKLGSIAGKSSSGGVSAPSSSPPHSTTSPETTLDMSTSVFLPREEKEVGRGVTQMTGGLEWLKMGEKADEPPVVMKGTAGTAVKLGTNYIRLELAEDRGMWEYEVKFSPSIDSKDERHKLLQQHRELTGPTRTFDGIMLCLPDKLAQDQMKVEAVHSVDNSIVDVTITLKHRKTMADRSTTQFYNILFRKIMKTLKMVEMNRNFYNPVSAMMVPQHKLEIWPGYVTAVHEYEGGVMLCLDISHKVLRTTTAHDLLMDIHAKDKDNMQVNAQKALLGAIVMTRYNNLTYKVDEIDFTQNCLSTFVDHNGVERSFVDYYKVHYGITIQDVKQPLLIHRVKKKTVEEAEVTKLMALVPELCTMTGLTDAMKNDFKVMKDVALFTRITPSQRQVAMQKFLDNVHNSAEASAHLLNWGLKLSNATVRLEGRKLPPEKLALGKKVQVKVTDKADWAREVTSSSCLSSQPLKKWVVVYVQKNADVVKNFVQLMLKLAPKMGFQVAQPEMAELPNDRTETYVKTIRDKTDPSLQLVCAIMPTPRDDRYAAVKRVCCVERPVASQVINFRTISNEKKVSSVVQKVALQINCKLGGELWACDIPMKHLMVVGVDVYHDITRRLPSIAGIVSSTNAGMSRWYSSTVVQASGQELIDLLKPAFVKAIKEYYKANHAWPEKILVFRDGVGDSQLTLIAKYEATQFKDTFRHVAANYNPSFGFVVVQKRINTRIFQLGGKAPENPAPGTVLDHTVTKRDWYDFFLVSQHVGQGTVSPTHYIVVHDNTGLKPDIIQKISYKLTHMYYNWPGTVRVPAPCQYAHKLAYQVGEHIHKEPSEQLNDRLFYL